MLITTAAAITRGECCRCSSTSRSSARSLPWASRPSIRFYETAEEGGEEGGDFVQSTYAVTFTDDKSEDDVFHCLGDEPHRSTASDRCDWTMGRVDGPERPPGW